MIKPRVMPGVHIGKGLSFLINIGSYGLESSGNMRPSPSDSASLKRVRARKQMAIRQSLHGKQEVCNSFLPWGLLALTM